MTCNNRDKTIELGMDLEKNKWKYYSPTFEFTEDIPLSIDFSPWGGHSFFVYDLVANTKPKVIVELGTYKGSSLLAFAQAVKDLNLQTELHAIDTWEGDIHSGFYKNDIYELFMEVKNKYYKDLSIIPHKMLFNDAVKKFKDNSIDILHIDGLHTYEAVKHDFETWLPKVNKNTGIIMFHDVCETKDDFGVYKLWDELKKKYKNTITFEHYHGLGVIFLNNNIKDIKKNLFLYYTTLSKNQDLEYSNKELQKELVKTHKTLRGKEKMIEEKDKIIERKDKAIQKKDILIEEYKSEVEEFRSFKKGVIWRLLDIWRKFKNLFTNTKKEPYSKE